VLFDVFVINIYIPRHISSHVDLDETVTSFSKWDPAQFSLQWQELVEMGRVLLWKLVEKMAFVEFDVVKLAEIVASSTPERDPVRFSKQWPELFKSDRVLSWETVGGLTFINRDIVSAVWSHGLDTKGCGRVNIIVCYIGCYKIHI